MFEKIQRLPLYAQTLVAMALGIVVGIVFEGHTSQFGLVGKAIIMIIKTFATPLLFFAILDSWIHSQFSARGLVLMFGISLFDAFWALLIAVGINTIFEPGKYMVLPSQMPAPSNAFASVTKVNLADGLMSNVPESLFKPFLDHNVPAIILIAIFLGVGINQLRREHGEYEKLGVPFDKIVHAMFLLTQRVLAWVVHLVPLAVFAAVAQSVGTQGFSALKGLGAYLAAGLGGMALHILLTYNGWIIFVSRVGFRRFWKEAKEPVFFGTGVNSSLATLPLTLSALDRMGVSKTSARLSACIGTNFNNDGILLYEAMAVLFIAQAYGIHLTWAQQLTACAICLITAFGVAGVPEAGVIGLALVLNNVGVPIDILPLLLTVDWIVARARSATNVISDMTVAAALDRFEGPAVG